MIAAESIVPQQLLDGVVMIMLCVLLCLLNQKVGRL